jgi:thiol-disulfide isomerase/thioredoxin
MSTLSKICLLATTWLFIVSGCNPDQDKRARITIASTTQPNSAVEVSLIKNLNKVSLVESKTDSVGYSSFEIGVHEPTIALIQIGEKYGEVYLAPGYRLFIKENGQDYQIPVTFSGKGADVNNYISWVNSNVERIKWTSGKGLMDLNMNEFRSWFDSLKTTITHFHKHYLDSVALPDDIVSTLQYKNNIKFLAIEAEYKFFRLNDLNNKKWEAYKNGRDYTRGEAFKELEELGDDIPFDSLLLAGAYADYDRLLNFYWRSNVYLPIAGELVGSADAEKSIPLLTAARIRKADRPDAVREGLLAFNVMFWLGVYGITPETDSIFSHFGTTYRQSGYLASLNKTYDEFLSLAPGKPAPEFEGITPEGKKVSIKDLRGKLVYVDIWATWCGPCIAEIPSSIKLQQKLANEDGIQFVNVSVDANKSAWEKFLKKNNSWTGMHIIVEPEEIDSLYRSYKLSGVPAYILIDQAGNIIDVKALRPSDEKLEIKMRQLLGGQL